MDVIYNRFTTIDPLSEKYPHISPYAYCIGNPIKYVDPDGMDWALYSLDGKADATWNWVDGKEYRTGVNDTNGKEVVLPTYEAVAVFDGSYDEKLGTKRGDQTGLYINGEGAITAKVTVYGTKGPDDIGIYVGFTMSSDFKKYGAIDNGEYDVKYRNPGKNDGLPSNYAVNNRAAVNCLGGVNPSSINPYSSTQKDKIWIHATNRSGKAGGNIIASSGCLLIQGGNHWDNFKAQIGPRDFRLILNRK